MVLRRNYNSISKDLDSGISKDSILSQRSCSQVEDFTWDFDDQDKQVQDDFYLGPSPKHSLEVPVPIQTSGKAKKYYLYKIGKFQNKENLEYVCEVKIGEATHFPCEPIPKAIVLVPWTPAVANYVITLTKKLKKEIDEIFESQINQFGQMSFDP